MAANRPPDHIGFGERIGTAFQQVMRSWTMLFIFVAIWFVWWAKSPPQGGWTHFLLHFTDPFPYVFWGNVLAAVTFLDMIVVGISQVQQGKRQDEMLRTIYKVMHRLEEAERLQTQMVQNQMDSMSAIHLLIERDVKASEHINRLLEEARDEDRR